MTAFFVYKFPIKQMSLVVCCYLVAVAFVHACISKDSYFVNTCFGGNKSDPAYSELLKERTLKFNK